MLELRQRPSWRLLAPSGLERQEVSYVEAGGKLYLAGGGTRHQAYDPATGGWSGRALPRASTTSRVSRSVDVSTTSVASRPGPAPRWCTYCASTTATDSFTQGTPMPRPRGAGAVVAHEGRVYYAGGLHGGTAVPWFDVYDPRADRWRSFPDMPRARDHFQAAVAGDTLYTVGGANAISARRSPPRTRTTSKRPSGGPASPPSHSARRVRRRERRREVLVFGGEVEDRALASVEAYDPETDVWRALEPVSTPRHGVQAAVCGGAVYLAAGGQTPGDAEPTDAHEVYVPADDSGCHTGRGVRLTGECSRRAV